MSIPENAMNTGPYEDDVLPPELLVAWEPLECLGYGENHETLLLRSRADGSFAVAKCRPAGDDKDGTALLKNLSHPALPRFLAVYDGEQKYCVLREYIPGETLQELADGIPFSKEKTLSVVSQLCDVLEYLHTLVPPVIHRDIKPENVILREDGSVALIDFGIARVYRKNATHDTSSMGTAAFAPPEQYGFRQTDSRSDIYSLGILAGWMLTGSTDPDSFAGIEDEKLGSLVRRCTAFDPANRYPSARDVSAALRKMQAPEKKNRRGRLIMLCAAILAALAVAVGLLLFRSSEKAIVFQEPLIEQAVRMAVGKTGGEALTEEDLSTVEGLYIFADTVVGNEDEFYNAVNDWYAENSGSSGPRGSIVTVEDLSQLPNLKAIFIAAEQISDISPLAGLTQLEKLEFKHNDISDISALEGMEHLWRVGLNSNPVTDLSVLCSLPNLRFLDLCDVSDYDGAILERLGKVDFLDISNRTDSWQHLGIRSIMELKLGWTGINSLEWLSGVSGLTTLELQHTSITSLESIEQHTQLETLRLSGNAIEDFTPLLSLPALRQVTLSEDQAENAAVLEGSGITILYE